MSNRGDSLILAEANDITNYAESAKVTDDLSKNSGTGTGFEPYVQMETPKQTLMDTLSSLKETPAVETPNNDEKQRRI